MTGANNENVHYNKYKSLFYSRKEKSNDSAYCLIKCCKVCIKEFDFQQTPRIENY